MGEHGTDVLQGLQGPGRELRRLIPEIYDGFSKLNKSAMAEGALSVKTKELMALALAVTRQCDGCIAAHARGAARAGAVDAEVAEAIGVALMMSGGPGTVYGPRAYAAFCDFKETEA